MLSSNELTERVRSEIEFHSNPYAGVHRLQNLIYTHIEFCHDDENFFDSLIKKGTHTEEHLNQVFSNQDVSLLDLLKIAQSAGLHIEFVVMTNQEYRKKIEVMLSKTEVEDLSAIRKKIEEISSKKKVEEGLTIKILSSTNAIKTISKGNHTSRDEPRKMVNFADDKYYLDAKELLVEIRDTANANRRNKVL